jgi:hypothetical protein
MAYLFPGIVFALCAIALITVIYGIATYKPNNKY